MTPKEFIDKLRTEFDGGNGFIYRIYQDRERSYTVDEFLKLPAQEFWGSFIVVCRDGYGWYLDRRGGVYGFPVPWDVPGPGEYIAEQVLK